MTITAKYGYFPERREFVGAIFDEERVLTIGCETSEAKIQRWCQNALEKRPWIPGNPRAEDMYDRATFH